MLNIPAEIQALYKTDGIRKNFRVHFPNGESPDLTNSDIVAGSVSFTESVCSKDVLQFGLAEASRIEFECANVQNIYGMTIECGIEVDTSSLSAADITTIQGNPGDGTLVLSADSDIGYGFYRVPYGVFTVSSCPRSAGAMWKRRVEAYSKENVSTIKPTPFLSAKLQTRIASDVYQNVKLLLCGEQNDVSSLSLTPTVISPLTTIYSQAQLFTSWRDGNDTYMARFSANVGYQTYTITDSVNSLCRMTCTIDKTQINPIYAQLDAYNATVASKRYVRGMLEPSAVMTGDGWTPYNIIPFENPSDSGYRYLSMGGTSSNVTYPSTFNSAQFTILKNGTVVNSYSLTPYISNVTVTKYELADSLYPHYLIKLEPSSSEENNNTVYKSYIDSIDLPSLYVADYELHAEFGNYDRSAKLTSVSLSKSSPIAMSTDEYSSLWWDEYNIAPIGSITVTYKDIDLNEDQTILYEFGTGESTYDMTNNYLLKNLAVSADNLNNQTVQEYVTSLLDTYFIPNIQDVAFTPVQLTSLGLPYLEAGDYLEIDDGNGGTVGTYIMSRTLSGVQFLEDDIESKGGEIIGNVRSA